MTHTTKPLPTYHEIREQARRWYWTEIRSIVREAIEAVASGEIEDYDALETWLHETIDSHAYVIYTGKAELVCFATERNTDELALEMGGACGVSQRAYLAMHADCGEQLSLWEARYYTDEHTPEVIALMQGWDITDDSTYPANREEETSDTESTKE